MLGGNLIFAAVVGTGSGLAQLPTGAYLNLLPNVGRRLDYNIHRVWKSAPVKTGNGDQVHDIKVELSFQSQKPLYRMNVQILDFSGKDLDGGETKHLQQIRPEIIKGRLSRFATTGGVIGPWRAVQDSTNNAGWAGMMVDKAVGLYEVGFLEINFPAKGFVAVGQTWTKKVVLGDEGLRGPGSSGVKGQEAVCTYQLKSVDPASKTATISFHCGTNIRYFFRPTPTAKKYAAHNFETQWGVWTISLTRGVPIKFHAERSVTRSMLGQKATESTVTDVQLIRKAQGPMMSGATLKAY